jgi:hypothetical protein
LVYFIYILVSWVFRVKIGFHHYKTKKPRHKTGLFVSPD